MAHEKMAPVLENGILSYWLALSYDLFQKVIKIKKIIQVNTKVNLKFIQVNTKEQLLINYKKFF